MAPHDTVSFDSTIQALARRGALPEAQELASEIARRSAAAHLAIKAFGAPTGAGKLSAAPMTNGEALVPAAY